MAKRNRIIFPSQSVWADGMILHRVQTLGSTTTFTSEDIFELGTLDIIDVVDDVPAVAITLETLEWGDVHTMAKLAGQMIREGSMTGAADVNTGHLVLNKTVVSGTDAFYYHGVHLGHFISSCGKEPGVALWAPVQSECSVGTTNNAIDQTLFMDRCFINSIALSYSTGANATENYNAETDNKMWLLNEGRFVTYEEFVPNDGVAVGDSGKIYLGVHTVATLSDGSLAFLKHDEKGRPAVSVHLAASQEVVFYPIVSGVSAVADSFVYNPALTSSTTGATVFLPTALAATITTADTVKILYASHTYGYQVISAGETDITNGVIDRAVSMRNDDSGDGFRGGDYYFGVQGASRPEEVGAIRQGQIEIYLIDPALFPDADKSIYNSYPNDPADYDDLDNMNMALRLRTCNITANLTRAPLAELGHLAPYDRPVTVPVPITVTVETTAGDLETYATFAGRLSEYNASTIKDLRLTDLMSKDDLMLAVMIYQQTNEEAGGSGLSRKVNLDSMVGEEYSFRGTVQVYAASEREYPLKTVIVKDLVITDEAYNLGRGDNATQTFGFRGRNDLVVVKGFVPFEDLIDQPGFSINPAII